MATFISGSIKSEKGKESCLRKKQQLSLLSKIVLAVLLKFRKQAMTLL